MVRGRQRQQWNHTAGLMALIANVNRDPQKRPQPYEPADFHPLVVRPASGIPLTKDNFGMLKKAFVPGV